MVHLLVGSLVPTVLVTELCMRLAVVVVAIRGTAMCRHNGKRAERFSLEVEIEVGEKVGVAGISFGGQKRNQTGGYLPLYGTLFRVVRKVKGMS